VVLGTGVEEAVPGEILADLKDLWSNVTAEHSFFLVMMNIPNYTQNPSCEHHVVTRPDSDHVRTVQ
jgi:hypothetical protein